MTKKGKKKQAHGFDAKDGKNGKISTTTTTTSKQKKVRGNGVDDARLHAAVEADGKRTIVKMADDGNCLFRALSDQLYYDFGNNHEEVRSDVCDYLEAHEEEFRHFLVLDDKEADEDASDFQSYVHAMRQDGEWGGNLELVVAARLYRRNVVVFSANLAAFTIDHGSTDKKGASTDMMVSYHDNQHYNSVRDNSAPPPKLPVKPFVPEVKSLVPEAKDEVSNGSDLPCGTDNSHDVSHPDTKKNDVAALSTDGDINRNDKLRKNSTCPCGSGLRYKKCCLAKKKHEARVLTLRGSVPPNDGSDAEEAENIGGFRVLRI